MNHEYKFTYYPGKNVEVEEYRLGNHLSRTYTQKGKGRGRKLAWTCRAASTLLWDVTLRVGKTMNSKDLCKYNHLTDREMDKIITDFIGEVGV